MWKRISTFILCCTNCYLKRKQMQGIMNINKQKNVVFTFCKLRKKLVPRLTYHEFVINPVLFCVFGISDFSRAWNLKICTYKLSAELSWNTCFRSRGTSGYTYNFGSPRNSKHTGTNVAYGKCRHLVFILIMCIKICHNVTRYKNFARFKFSDVPIQGSVN